VLRALLGVNLDGLDPAAEVARLFERAFDDLFLVRSRIR
jgi:hypothetical protein